jgi:hypothetical protein
VARHGRTLRWYQRAYPGETREYSGIRKEALHEGAGPLHGQMGPDRERRQQ